MEKKFIVKIVEAPYSTRLEENINSFIQDHQWASIPKISPISVYQPRQESARYTAHISGYVYV